MRKCIVFSNLVIRDPWDLSKTIKAFQRKILGSKKLRWHKLMAKISFLVFFGSKNLIISLFYQEFSHGGKALWERERMKEGARARSSSHSIIFFSVSPNSLSNRAMASQPSLSDTDRRSTFILVLWTITRRHQPARPTGLAQNGMEWNGAAEVAVAASLVVWSKSGNSGIH